MRYLIVVRFIRGGRVATLCLDTMMVSRTTLCQLVSEDSQKIQ